MKSRILKHPASGYELSNPLDTNNYVRTEIYRSELTSCFGNIGKL